MTAAFGRRSRVKTPLRFPSRRPIPLPGDVEEQVYRLVQEALANIARHSRARHAVVPLRRRQRGQQLLVEVTDDGVGFDPSSPQPGHWGLRTMAQRMEQLGGSLLVDARPGRGARISATIPLSPLQSRLAVAQIVLTATSLPEIRAVLLTSDGDLLEAPLPSGELTTAPLQAEDFDPLLVAPPT